jgi:hypothetical protein
MLCDTGEDRFDKTPSNTGILYSLNLLKGMKDVDVTAHYVTRPYLTRHGDGHVHKESNRQSLSSGVREDRTNTFNEFQGGFRYGTLLIPELVERIDADSRGVKYEIELTHCDEMDREKEFKQAFGDKVNTYDSPIIK